MGYDLVIKRNSEKSKISKEEWINYVLNDSSFEKIDSYSAIFENGDELTLSTPNAGLWHSTNGKIPFTYDEEYGEIIVKNPDKKIIKKMINIAQNMDAIVVGEEGEVYDANYIQNEFAGYKGGRNSDKKWWKFWK